MRPRSAASPGRAVRAPEALLDDAHLHDRGFWKRSSTRSSAAASSIRARRRSITARPGGSPRRAPLIGEHNVEIFCGELGLSRGELALLAEQQLI